jgi:hypothetical protein
MYHLNMVNKQGADSMKVEVNFKGSNDKETFISLWNALKAKYGNRATIDEDTVMFSGITCEELTKAFEAQGYGEMAVFAINRKKNSFIWEDDNQGGYAENNFFLDWDGVNLLAETGGIPINEWSDE